jgi:hypothetical protein
MTVRCTQNIRNISDMRKIKFKVDYIYLLSDTKFKCNTEVGNSVTKQFYRVCITLQAVYNCPYWIVSKNSPKDNNIF